MKHYERLTTDMCDDVCACFRAGLTRHATAKLMGITENRIIAICNKYGITGWPTGAAARDQRGNKNPAFIDGMGRATIARATKRILIAADRDLFTCERCGDTRDIELPRHHIDRDRSNNVLSNIEVLCVACHNREHMHERTRDELGRFNGTI